VKCGRLSRWVSFLAGLQGLIVRSEDSSTIRPCFGGGAKNASEPSTRRTATEAIIAPHDDVCCPFPQTDADRGRGLGNAMRRRVAPVARPGHGQGDVSPRMPPLVRHLVRTPAYHGCSGDCLPDPGAPPQSDFMCDRGDSCGFFVVAQRRRREPGTMAFAREDDRPTRMDVAKGSRPSALVPWAAAQGANAPSPASGCDVARNGLSVYGGSDWRERDLDVRTRSRRPRSPLQAVWVCAPMSNLNAPESRFRGLRFPGSRWRETRGISSIAVVALATRMAGCLRPVLRAGRGRNAGTDQIAVLGLSARLAGPGR